MAGISYDNNGYDGERYERYNFDATEDDYIVCDILVNLEALIHNFNPTNSCDDDDEDEDEPITCSVNPTSSYQPTCPIPRWQNKRKRSALESPPSPPRVQYAPRRMEMKNEGHKFENLRIRDVKTGEKEENMVYSPSSPLSYEPIEDRNTNTNIKSNHQLKNKSKKKKLNDWEEHVKELEQTKQQLKLSLDNVRKYHQTLLELNTLLKDKRDEKYGEVRRKNLPVQVNGRFDLNLQKGHHQFPVFARQQQQQKGCTFQQGGGGGGMTFQYYPVSYFQANNKVLQAAEARHRRKIKINTKKNSNLLGIRRSSIS